MLPFVQYSCADVMRCFINNSRMPDSFTRTETQHNVWLTPLKHKLWSHLNDFGRCLYLERWTHQVHYLNLTCLTYFYWIDILNSMISAINLVSTMLYKTVETMAKPIQLVINLYYPTELIRGAWFTHQYAVNKCCLRLCCRDKKHGLSLFLMYVV